MVRGGTAASAQVGNADLSKFRRIGGKFFRTQGEAGLPVFQNRHACIGLDDDGLIGDGNHLAGCVKQLVGAYGAVGANHVGAHGIQKDGGSNGVRAGNGSAVFGIGHLADDRKAGRFLGCYKGGLHFLDVDDGFNNEAVRSGIRKRLGQAVVIFTGFIKGQIADGFDELSGGAHVAGYPDLIAAGGPYIPDRCLCDFLHLVRQVVVGKFDGRGTEGIGGDELTFRFHVGFVNLLHHIGMGNIVEIGAASCLKTESLQHGAHAAVKKYHKVLLCCEILLFSVLVSWWASVLVD